MTIERILKGGGSRRVFDVSTSEGELFTWNTDMLYSMFYFRGVFKRFGF